MCKDTVSVSEHVASNYSMSYVRIYVWVLNYIFKNTIFSMSCDSARLLTAVETEVVTAVTITDAVYRDVMLHDLVHWTYCLLRSKSRQQQEGASSSLHLKRKVREQNAGWFLSTTNVNNVSRVLERPRAILTKLVRGVLWFLKKLTYCEWCVYNRDLKECTGMLHGETPPADTWVMRRHWRGMCSFHFTRIAWVTAASTVFSLAPQNGNLVVTNLESVEGGGGVIVLSRLHDLGTTRTTRAKSLCFVGTTLMCINVLPKCP